MIWYICITRSVEGLHTIFGCTHINYLVFYLMYATVRDCFFPCFRTKEDLVGRDRREPISISSEIRRWSRPSACIQKLRVKVTNYHALESDFTI